MYTLNPHALRIIHEERITQITNDFAAHRHKVDRKPRKWNLKWFKRNEA